MNIACRQHQACAGSASRRLQRSHKRKAVICSVLNKSTTSTVAQTPTPTTTTLSKPPGGRIAVLRASKVGTIPIKEGAKPLAEYMALPASQYSVLDAKKIERLSEDTFRCYVGALTFFTWSVEPVLTLQVNVRDRGCDIRLLSCELQGSSVFQDLNSRFTATMSNEVRWAEGKDAGEKVLRSDTVIEICLEVPAWSAALPVESTGHSVMGATLNLMVPRFLQQLRDDYHRWAAGDASRKPMGNGTL